MGIYEYPPTGYLALTTLAASLGMLFGITLVTAALLACPYVLLMRAAALSVAAAGTLLRSLMGSVGGFISACAVLMPARRVPPHLLHIAVFLIL